ncbi:MAG: hypothetical protein V1255_07265, partial [Alphaproteobacteria bacterium]|nr:hypothetical protein [Alphaproteobacteria bacterium]
IPEVGARPGYHRLHGFCAGVRVGFGREFDRDRAVSAPGVQHAVLEVRVRNQVVLSPDECSDECKRCERAQETRVLRDYLNHMAHPVDRASECYSQEIMA